MALYRLPFPEEAVQTWYLENGSWDQNGHGVGQVANPTDEQAYAFDIVHATGGKVLAARAGTVIWLDEQWPDDTHPPGTPGPGNFIWIRHGDGTMAAYLHLKQNSVRVTEGQYVLQGAWIARNNNTGNSEPAHLHFDLHTYGEKGKTSAPGLGTQLLTHFEDKTRTFFRPADSEYLSGKSNNVEGAYRQDSWRQCGKCRALYFTPIPGSACPEGDEHQYDGGTYTLHVVGGVDPPGQKGWRYCSKCHALFFAASAKSRCPKGPGQAHTAWGDTYALVHDGAEEAGHQSEWRYCKNCAVLWFDATGSTCPATNGAHSSSGSGNYRLHHTADDWQRNWRLCAKCAGLFFGPQIAQSKCSGSPQSKGPHVVHSAPKYTHNYFLALESPDAPGQGGWRYCNKCQGLWMGLNANSACPATGKHSKQGSGEYRVIENADAKGPGEKGWRWCFQCQGLHHGGTLSGVAHKCPSGGDHKITGSKYRVQYDGA